MAAFCVIRRASTIKDSATTCARSMPSHACLEIISEAARRLPEVLQTRHPAIAWKEMAGASSCWITARNWGKWFLYRRTIYDAATSS